MTPLVMRDVPAEEYDLFQKICLVVREMPDVDLGRNEQGDAIPVSSHMVTGALAANFSSVAVKDGFIFKNGSPHSWLETKSGLIIDPYPVAMVGGPVMVLKKSYGSPWIWFYAEAVRGAYPEYSREPFLSHVTKVTKAVGQTISRLREIVPALL